MEFCWKLKFHQFLIIFTYDGVFHFFRCKKKELKCTSPRDLATPANEAVAIFFKRLVWIGHQWSSQKYC